MVRQYKNFLKKHFQELLKIGIPLQTLEEKNKWDYLIEHGDCVYTKWNSKRLEYNQIIRLIEIISEYRKLFHLHDCFSQILKNQLDEINKKLSLLNYSNKWMIYEMISTDVLIKQVNEFKEGNVENTEHYRYRSFRNFIDGNDSLSDMQVENVLELIDIDEDQTMTGSVMVKMLRKTSLTNAQFEIIVEKLKGFGEWTEKSIRKEIKRRTGTNNA